jgi:cellulose synthase/poly-beta-1,6-N-acetylglucosamine synthase-like glycosyltransferase
MWVFLFISLFCTGGFSILNLFNIFCYKDIHRRFSEHKIRQITHLYIMVPALNEVNEIVGTVNRLLTAIKPLPVAATLVIIDDGSNDGTHEKLLAFEDNSSVHVLTRKFPNAQKGKGEALNDGLAWIVKHAVDFKNAVVGVIDSDSQPNAQILMDVYNGFTHSKYDLLQTGIAINNIHNFLTLMQEFEFGVPNLLQQVIRMGWGSAIASGNGQFMTLEMANTIRWNNSLLDDLEFSINGLLHGFVGGFLANTFMPQEGVLKYRPLVKQRVRWCHGGMQCLFRYGKQVFWSKQISPQLKTDLLVFMILPFFSILFTISSFMATIVLVVRLVMWPQDTIVAAFTVISIGTVITTLMIFAADHLGNAQIKALSIKQVLMMAIGNLIYSWLMAPVAFIALFRLVTRQNDWSKTAHDQSTVYTSRRKPAQTAIYESSYQHAYQPRAAKDRVMKR